MRKPRRAANRQFRKLILRAMADTKKKQIIRSDRLLGGRRFPLRKRTNRVSFDRMRASAQKKRKICLRRVRHSAQAGSLLTKKALSCSVRQKGRACQHQATAPSFWRGTETKPRESAHPFFPISHFPATKPVCTAHPRPVGYRCPQMGLNT